jgi:hypothetical protein
MWRSLDQGLGIGAIKITGSPFKDFAEAEQDLPRTHSNA